MRQIKREGRHPLLVSAGKRAYSKNHECCDMTVSDPNSLIGSLQQENYDTKKSDADCGVSQSAANEAGSAG